ncbi:MAG: TPM domain-containing protein [Ruminococcus sp.]|jgi:hypothetical protein|nr:TPM domain-containing protein [Ruminococcus sp.]
MKKLFKKLSAFICAGAIACTAFAFSAFADTGRCIVYNNAISASEKADCEELLNDASGDIEYIAVFMDSSSVTDSQVSSLASNLSYKYSNCAVMVNNAGTRYTYVARTGDKTKRITSAKAQKIASNYINKELKNNDNVGAVKAFIKGVKRYKSFLSLGVILIGCAGFLIFFMIMYFAVRAKYKFHEKPSTNNYLEGGALNFGVMQDVFVSEHTSRTAISSGSGGSGGGGGSHSGGGSHY